jgi:hypothetical protein
MPDFITDTKKLKRAFSPDPACTHCGQPVPKWNLRQDGDDGKIYHRDCHFKACREKYPTDKEVTAYLANIRRTLRGFPKPIPEVKSSVTPEIEKALTEERGE